uniref:Uncharacterized protein n=1 Tax=Anguilla anguilla TaxID=7936 RepID=A0A0E9U7A6_ANGAN
MLFLLLPVYTCVDGTCEFIIALPCWVL